MYLPGPTALIPSRTVESAPRPWPVLLRAFWSLTKPRIMLLLLITTLAAALIAVRQHPLPAAALARVLAATLLGGALAAGGAAALNCYIDRDIDVVMHRTRRRPLPAGILQPRQVLLFGLVLTALAQATLLRWTTPAAAVLALLGGFYYVVVYTLWLKRATSQNIVIGGGAGAIPPLVGWAAVTGRLAPPALLLFLIIFLWTPAHFWSLALVTRRDYLAARVPMLPAVAGELYTKWRIFAYTALVVVATLLLYAIRVMGLFYLVAALLLGAGFLYRATRLLLDPRPGGAWSTFMYSNFYLALIFVAMVIDRLALG